MCKSGLGCDLRSSRIKLSLAKRREQVTGKELDARSDLFTLAIVLTEMIILRPLFSGLAGLAAPPSSLESDFYATITKAASQEFSGAPVLPFLSAGATDSAQLRLHNVQAYGVSPFPMTDEDSRRMHADDERIPLASFDKGVDFLARIVAEFAASK